MLCVNLFGKLDIRYADGEFRGCDSRKSKELFAYLLLNRDRPHAREKLASLLWGDHCTTTQSRKYLRNALWQLRSGLDDRSEFAESRLLVVEPDWIQLNSVSMLHLDVKIFEAAYTAVEGVSGYSLGRQGAHRLDQALQLYRNDLLESWYQDWCLQERERMLGMYLIMLDKMMAYCESHHQFERGLAYGHIVLQRYRARECAHRRMMRLYYLSGDRSRALRQYERCVGALRDELDVRPSERTTELYEQVCTDRLELSPPPMEGNQEVVEDVLWSLQVLEANLSDLQKQVERAVKTVRMALRNSRPSSLRGSGDGNGQVHAWNPGGQRLAGTGRPESSLP